MPQPPQNYSLLARHTHLHWGFGILREVGLGLTPLRPCAIQKSALNAGQYTLQNASIKNTFFMLFTVVVRVCLYVCICVRMAMSACMRPCTFACV